MSETRQLETAVADLLPRAQAGDAAARDELLRRCHGTVYRWALVQTGDPDDAEDVAQDVLVRVYRYLDRYSGRARFTTWLYQVTRNAALGWRRQMASRLRVLRNVAMDRAPAAASAEDPVDRLHASRIAEVVTALFQALPARQREVFHLAEIEGVALVEIAERLAMNPSTVRAHLFRARRALRSRILAGHPGLAEERRR
ncbi:MAG TPA: sigma-70 family RNA polymerase sigma factor [Gemmatimonadales bacterium]|nr:sigma-70 family RNA polymerase sigma factor [Gemmatimonadales bacterium]